MQGAGSSMLNQHRIEIKGDCKIPAGLWSGICCYLKPKAINTVGRPIWYNNDSITIFLGVKVNWQMLHNVCGQAVYYLRYALVPSFAART